MVEPLPYTYEPVYGAEPYKDNGGVGGANVTGDNLVITAWEVGKKFGNPPDYMSFGQILKPVSQNSANGETGAPLNETDGISGGIQAFPSRHSFKGYIVSSAFNVVGLVLNPPPEMKQLLAGSLAYNGGDPFDPTSYTVSKSLQCSYAWRFGLDDAEEAHNIQTVSVGAALFSTYYWLNDLIFDAAIARVPFLKTNGANGIAPVFFDASISSGVNEMIEAVNDGGDYFVAFSMPIDTGSENEIGNYMNVVYPHSAARG